MSSENLVYIFITVSLGANLVLAFFTQFRSSNSGLRLPVWLLSFLLPVNSAILHWSNIQPHWLKSLVGTKIFIAVNGFVLLSIIEFIQRFLRDKGNSTPYLFNLKFLPVTWVWRMVPLFALALVFSPHHILYFHNNQEQGIIFQTPFIPIIMLLLALYGLYLLENTYRFAQDVQRKIGRLCFISLTILGLYHIYFYARILLYKTFFAHYAEITIVLFGLTIPAILVGIVKYRLGLEKVYVPRNTIYTSATVFLTGAVFIGVAITVTIFKWFKFDFSYFTNFLIGFSLFFFTILAVGSGNMRKRIIRYVNQQFYTRKYDYREQFFQLHKTIMAGADLSFPIIELVENMKYSVTVDDAYVFLINWKDGNYYLHENKERATQANIILHGDSIIIKILEEKKKPIDFLKGDEYKQNQLTDISLEEIIKKLKIDALFPILHKNELLGILAMRGGRQTAFDFEDLSLIQVFANTMGDLMFKHKILNERIVQKQFESFNNIASFIIHDIKNQIATLSLILKNSEKNLSNPKFQKSMLTSVASCSNNLQSLINKLTMAPKSHTANIQKQPLKNVLDEIAVQAKNSLPESVRFELDVKNTTAEYDKTILFFIINNLLRNALEAMKNKGVISIEADEISSMVDNLKLKFGSGNKFFSPYNAYIRVFDNGPGMSEDFMNNHLFRPFSTTKEKGVGIGLYQCKTQIEKMGGIILCYSKQGFGTEFCILLK